jgi:putative pyruvate formate lyase activating enzyme
MLTTCTLCPHECLVNRLEGEHGVCRSTDELVISSAGPHWGEEPPLVGSHGSGTIFFASCNLKCQYCQNYEISQHAYGRRTSKRELAEIMLRLEREGCHNINLVTPTHIVPQIVEALAEATDRGLSLPVVYNCGGYESVETLRLLEGVVDIYMPDIKYADADVAQRYSGVDNYPGVAMAALREMHRQVGDLVCDASGIARHGLLVRHLVLPDDLAGTEMVVRFLAGVSPDTYLNLMGQYRPCYRAHEHPALARRPTSEEMARAFRQARAAGLRRLDGRP